MKAKEIAEKLPAFTLPEYREIPDIGLYLDQVTKYVNTYMNILPDAEVTPSMITNSIKHKIVKRLNKKTYTRDQIAAFLFIAVCKSVLSMDDIRIILNDEKNNGSYQETYIAFRDALQSVLEMLSNGKGFLPERKKRSEEEILMAHIAAAAGYQIWLKLAFAEMKKPD